jgi:CRP-like cAMP-binding protein
MAMGRSAQLAGRRTHLRRECGRNGQDWRVPRSSATSHELARVELLAGLPGETLARLAKRMERHEVAPGTVLVREGEPGGSFFVVFAGMLSVSQRDRGNMGVLRPGDYFGEVALAMRVPRTATVAAITPAVVASCDAATFDEFLRPLFADDD